MLPLGCQLYAYAEIQLVAAGKFSEHCSFWDAVNHRMLTDLFLVLVELQGFLLFSCRYLPLPRVDRYSV